MSRGSADRRRRRRYADLRGFYRYSPKALYKRELTLPFCFSLEGEIGYKTATAFCSSDGVWSFRPLTTAARYPVVATAICTRYPGTPHDLEVCTCGFYAVNYDLTNRIMFRMVMLRVRLEGTIIEHEIGYRATHQIVEHVSFHPHCFDASCSKRPVGLILPRTTNRAELVLPRCDEHSLPYERLITLDEAASQLGCTTSWLQSS